jgi:uncharacterized protein
MGFLRYVVAFALAFTLAAAAHAQFQPVPPLRGHVNDEIGMLDSDQRQQLETMLADYEAKTGSQIVVLLVKSTEPEAIEQYSIRVTDQWKLGRKGVDDGVLLLVARDNPRALRRLRIEAGRGVQGVLTDAQSKRILQDVIAPYFRQERYYDGLVAGVDAIAALLNHEKFPAAGQGRQVRQQETGMGDIFGSLVAIIVGIFLILSFFRPRRSRLSSGWGSGATGFIIGSILGNMSRGGNRGGWGDGGCGGGGGFGGGGFSGGGGTFDGGGASGDW